MEFKERNEKGELIIKPELRSELREEAGGPGKAIKMISSVLGVEWDSEVESVKKQAEWTEEEEQHLEELVALAEKVGQIKQWTEGIEKEYDDLENEEVLRNKPHLNERENEYLEVKKQLRGEEMEALMDYHELIVEFLELQRAKIV